MSLRDQALLVMSAGINVRNLDPMDVFLLAAKIIADEPLRQVALLDMNLACMPKGTRTEILRSWPESERRALRERITGVIQIGKK
jgi:hypothetical protein